MQHWRDQEMPASLRGTIEVPRRRIVAGRIFGQSQQAGHHVLEYAVRPVLSLWTAAETLGQHLRKIHAVCFAAQTGSSSWLGNRMVAWSPSTCPD